MASSGVTVGILSLAILPISRKPKRCMTNTDRRSRFFRSHLPRTTWDYDQHRYEASQAPYVRRSFLPFQHRRVLRLRAAPVEVPNPRDVSIGHVDGQAMFFPIIALPVEAVFEVAAVGGLDVFG